MNSLNPKPFPHKIFKNFLSTQRKENLLNALKQENFSEKNADLFTFYQTKDLKTSKQKAIQDFYKELIAFIPELEMQTNLQLNEHIDLFGSLYQPTHYLLPHDDRLESRKIAFIYYLTSLKKNQGGALVLYKDKKPHTKIQPKENTLIIFKVSKYSLHAIEEVLNGNRIALTGWFHGP